MSRFTSLMLILVIALSLSACSSSNVARVRLSEKDAGREVELHSADRLAITLEGNPTTGYQWEVASVDSAILNQIGDAEFKPDSTALGSPGKVTLTFGAVASGQTTLKLIYHRAFEKGVPPLKTFEVTVIVK
jgi:inhibitor of cysteine peptidase